MNKIVHNMVGNKSSDVPWHHIIVLVSGLNILGRRASSRYAFFLFFFSLTVVMITFPRSGV